MSLPEVLVGKEDYRENQITCEDGKLCHVTYQFDNNCPIPMNIGSPNCFPPCHDSACEYKFMAAMCPQYDCSYPHHTIIIVVSVTVGVLILVGTFVTAFCCLRRVTIRFSRRFPFFTEQQFSPDIDTSPLMDEDDAEQTRILRTEEGRRRARELLDMKRAEIEKCQNEQGSQGFTTAEVHAAEDALSEVSLS